MQRITKFSVFVAVGILVAGFAIFAQYFGLDANAGWSKGRIALVIFGLLIVFIPWLLRRRSAASVTTTQHDLLFFPILLVVMGVYFWFVTVSYDTTSNYYSLLATSFRDGELSLPLKPDPALLALPNPYDPAARQGLKVPQDLSLYNGKFYLYWGPVPSLLLAIFQPFLPWKISEVGLLFLFLCGIFLSLYWLILHIWDRFFSQIPRWIVILSILVSGLANPALWLLSQPKIYEAAIAGAQFFFISGLLSVVLALDRQHPSKWGLALAGTLWALAVGTRSVAMFPIFFMTLMVVYLLFKMYGRSFSRFVVELIPFGLPLFIGALAFSWYNWARFSSFLETGFSYQLAAPYLQKYMNLLFSPAYLFQNLYNYLLNPLNIQQPFPFLYPLRGRIEEIVPGQTLPELYTAQAITGFLYAAPFMLFACIPLVILVRQFLRRKQLTDSERTSEAHFFNWITISLIGSFALPFISLLTFFWAAMRYMEDFMPSLVLLSTIGFWQGYQRLAHNAKTEKIYVSWGTILAILSMINAVLLALSIYYTRSLL